MFCTALHAVACHEDALNIECYDGDVINVISANYGRRDTEICPVDYWDLALIFYYAYDDECTYGNALQIAENKSVEY